ncbi:MAG TPA: response regulator [Allosphingosinicella sp.]|jgi:CheY-like chemotaxis protein|nr:response regulator [Allosphingosinicella sp.]
MVRSVDSRVVLVVDDEVFARLLAVQIFLDQGFTVLEAQDAEEALDVLDRNDDVSLLFTDVSMPGAMDGLQLIEHVGEEWPHIRCIATSGRVDPRLCTLAGGARFLPKPYTAFHLMEAIRQSESGEPHRQHAAAA